MDVLILAGGENKRMPVIKGFLEIRGRRIIDSTVELLRDMFDRVIISSNTPELYSYLGVPIVRDVVKQKGPMIGILSALKTFKVPEIFVTACDMPFIKPALVRYIIAHERKVMSETRKWGAIIPIFENRPQPLLGIYSGEIVHTMEQVLKEGIRKLRDFLGKIEVCYVPEHEVRSIDPEGRSFVNINTPEDFTKEIEKYNKLLV